MMAIEFFFIFMSPAGFQSRAKAPPASAEYAPPSPAPRAPAAILRNCPEAVPAESELKPSAASCAGRARAQSSSHGSKAARLKLFFSALLLINIRRAPRPYLSTATLKLFEDFLSLVCTKAI